MNYFFRDAGKLFKNNLLYKIFLIKFLRIITCFLQTETKSLKVDYISLTLNLPSVKYPTLYIFIIADQSNLIILRDKFVAAFCNFGAISRCISYIILLYNNKIQSHIIIIIPGYICISYDDAILFELYLLHEKG